MTSAKRASPLCSFTFHKGSSGDASTCWSTARVTHWSTSVMKQPLLLSPHTQQGAGSWWWFPYLPPHSVIQACHVCWISHEGHFFFSFTSELTYKVGQKARTVLYFFCTLALLLVYHWMNEWMVCVLDLHFSDPIFLFIIFILKMSQSTSKGQEKDTWWKETSWLDILLLFFFFTSHDHHFSICLAEKNPKTCEIQWSKIWIRHLTERLLKIDICSTGSWMSTSASSSPWPCRCIIIILLTSLPRLFAGNHTPNQISKNFIFSRQDNPFSF